ncbi:MAG TPA: copper homeostasis protein CutC [Flavisolibacter sp.]|nr:copper homeostasis protein CutC [Flavisolibacter sp.]
MKYIIEIATTDFTTTKSAIKGGADRIELCAALSDGGTTPSYGTIKKCRETFASQLFPIIRPRGGDFLYTEEEYGLMLEDIIVCKNLGCDGIVTGLLKIDGTFDIERTSTIINLAYPMEVTVHRAFDRCIDPFAAIEQLIELGCQRILTSGQKPTATEGIEFITALIKAANDRIIIMPGSGVRIENIKELKDKTGAVEFHSSLRSTVESNMKFMHPSFGKEDSYTNPGIDANDVQALREALKE